MKEKHSEARPGMEWHEMDIRDLKFDSGSIDVALDKGTMECVGTRYARRTRVKADTDFFSAAQRHGDGQGRCLGAQQIWSQPDVRHARC